MPREKKTWRKATALHVPDMVEKSYRDRQKVLQEEWWLELRKMKNRRSDRRTFSQGTVFAWAGFSNSASLFQLLHAKKWHSSKFLVSYWYILVGAAFPPVGPLCKSIECLMTTSHLVTRLIFANTAPQFWEADGEEKLLPCMFRVLCFVLFCFLQIKTLMQVLCVFVFLSFGTLKFFEKEMLSW